MNLVRFQVLVPILPKKDNVLAQRAREVLFLGLHFRVPKRTLVLATALAGILAKLGLPVLKRMRKLARKVMLDRMNTQQVVAPSRGVLTV